MMKINGFQRLVIVSSFVTILGFIVANEHVVTDRFVRAATLEATGTAESSEPACLRKLMSGTAEPTSEATGEATLQSTELATVTNTALSYITLEPFDVRFNPNPEKAFAVVMNFTLFIQNNLKSDLDLQRPKFKLSIEGVPWSDVASTDFQIGTLQGNARHGIVLQTLTLLKKADNAQLQVLECIKAKVPVDLHLTGTLELKLNGKIELAEADVFVEQTVLPVSN